MPRFAYLVTTTVGLGRCRCGAIILTGYSEGDHAMVDPWPADRVTEIIALVTGRWTYTLINRQLLRRAGSTPPGPVLIEHRCGHPLTAPPSVPQDQTCAGADPPF